MCSTLPLCNSHLCCLYNVRCVKRRFASGLKCHFYLGRRQACFVWFDLWTVCTKALMFDHSTTHIVWYSSAHLSVWLTAVNVKLTRNGGTQFSNRSLQYFSYCLLFLLRLVRVDILSIGNMRLFFSTPSSGRFALLQPNDDNLNPRFKQSQPLILCL